MQEPDLSVSVFFHVGAMAETTKILAEQLDGLKVSGLLDWTDRSYATLAGWDGSDMVRGYSRQLAAAGFTEVVVDPDLKKWEFPTVTALWEHCRQTNSSKHFVLYLHTKGSSKPGDPDAGWRRELMDFVVRDWRQRVRELDGGRLTSGPRFLASGAGGPGEYVHAHGHYSGNMWWAASDYVSRLPHPATVDSRPLHRWAAEAWLGQHRGINQMRSDVDAQ
jgi:hypothetical protein